MSEEKQQLGETTETKDLLEKMHEEGWATVAPAIVETNENVENTKAPEEKVVLTLEQRIEVLQELSVLQSLINTSYFLPKFDQGNKGKTQPKITGSVQLNYFNGQQLQEMGERCAYLLNLLK